MFTLFMVTFSNYIYAGLIFECPFKEELDTCPYKNIRKMDVKDRFKIFNNYTLDYQKSLINAHLDCIKKRETLNLSCNNHLNQKIV